MKLPISKRLLACADFVESGARVADIGTDHGYLAIYLLKEKTASRVIACDLRRAPLENAQKNAAKFGVTENLSFRLADGLAAIAPDEVDTVVMAGMGGDLMQMILEKAPWLQNEKYSLILQPQSAVPPLRKWLCEQGFETKEERLLSEGGFFYTVMRLQFGTPQTLTPGQQYLPPQLLSSRSPLLAAYAERMEMLVQTTVDGLSGAEKQRTEKLRYFSQALEEIREMRKKL